MDGIYKRGAATGDNYMDLTVYVVLDPTPVRGQGWTDDEWAAHLAALQVGDVGEP